MNDPMPPEDPAAQEGPFKSAATSFRGVVAVAVVAAVATWGIFRWGWPSAESTAQPRPLPMAGMPLEGSPFIGSRACRGCHPGEYAAYTSSGHSMTLAPAGETAIAHRIAGKEFADPEQPGVTWRYAVDGKSLVAERVEKEIRLKVILDYALGSGRHAMTFVSLSRDGKAPPSGEEHRMSYFAHSDTVALTPGQRNLLGQPGQTATGSSIPPPVVLDCFECHGTRTAPPFKQGLAPETMIPDVSCERCHGPGRAHVEAASKGAGAIGPDLASLAMPFAGEESGPEQVAMCGRCHRLPNMLPTSSIRPDNSLLARFPSVGLSVSACFTKSAGALSCTTCHDPHGRASSDTSMYEAACLSCHATGAKPEGRTATTPADPCPVNPRDRCIECHMPRRKPSDAGLRFTDHWIRIPDRPDADPGSAKPAG